MDLYVADGKFKKMIEEHRDLKPSGSNLQINKEKWL